jgi:uncharacterized protein
MGWAVLAVFLLPGCTAFRDHRATLESLYAAGRYQEAAAMLDDPKVHAMYGAKNELLWKLDRGAIAMALGDSPWAVELLNRAEDSIELRREKDGGDVAAQWLLNDTESAYLAEPYEDLYLNVIKLLAHLEAGTIDGGATVEARRLASKADVLRDRWLKYEDALEKKGGPELAAARTAGLTAVNTEGEFLESPLGTYLSAVTFMKSGAPEFQSVAGKRLADSIRLQQALIGPARPEEFEGLGEMRPQDANVLFVALSGRGPTKYAERVGPIPLGTLPVYFELPKLRANLSEVASARMEVEGGETKRLAFIEDMAAVAVENHERALPAIAARTIARYMVKAGLSLAATEAARRSARDSNQGLVQIAGVLGGLLVLGATEQADLRCWIFLPGQARVGLAKLPPGTHRVRIVYEGSGGGDLYSTPWQDITVKTPDGLADGANALTSIVGHYWR